MNFNLAITADTVTYRLEVSGVLHPVAYFLYADVNGTWVLAMQGLWGVRDDLYVNCYNYTLLVPLKKKLEAERNG